MKVPSLNDTPLHCLPANSLVRYRCMVQDMFDPEFYMGEYEVSDINTKTNLMKSGKYKDIAECAVCINSCSIHICTCICLLLIFIQKISETQTYIFHY